MVKRSYGGTAFLVWLGVCGLAQAQSLSQTQKQLQGQTQFQAQAQNQLATLGSRNDATYRTALQSLASQSNGRSATKGRWSSIAFPTTNTVGMTAPKTGRPTWWNLNQSSSQGVASNYGLPNLAPLMPAQKPYDINPWVDKSDASWQAFEQTFLGGATIDDTTTGSRYGLRQGNAADILRLLRRSRLDLIKSSGDSLARSYSSSLMGTSLGGFVPNASSSGYGTAPSGYGFSSSAYGLTATDSGDILSNSYSSSNMVGGTSQRRLTNPFMGSTSSASSQNSTSSNGQKKRKLNPYSLGN